MPQIQIYKIYSATHDKYYIGQTNNFNARMSQHQLRNTNCSSHLIWKMSDDVSDVCIDIIAEADTQAKANNLEKMFILQGRNCGLCINKQLPLGDDETMKERQKVNTKRYIELNREKWNAYMNKRNLDKKIKYELMEAKIEELHALVDLLVEDNMKLSKMVQNK